MPRQKRGMFFVRKIDHWWIATSGRDAKNKCGSAAQKNDFAA